MHILKFVILFLFIPFSGCVDAIHEFPHPVSSDDLIEFNVMSITLDPTFMQYSPDVVFTRGGQNNMQRRFIIDVYSMSGEIVERRVAFSEPVIQNTYIVNQTFMLSGGNYKFVLWSDFVLDTDKVDLFYDTRDLESIVFACDYIGGEELREAYYTSQDIDLQSSTDKYIEKNFTLKTPFSRYRIISTDLNAFIDNDKYDLSEINVQIDYIPYLYCGFNALLDGVCDFNAGFKFTYKAEIISQTEVILAWDFIFAGSSEFSTNVTMTISDAKGAIINIIPNIAFPCLKQNVTTIKGDFLTLKAKQGIGIDHLFEGDFNIML